MKKHLFIILLISLFIGLYQEVKGQSDGIYYLDGQGRPMKKSDLTLEDIEGSVFLSDQWAIGIIVNASGMSYKNIKLKYNVLNDQLIYAGPNDELMIFDKPAKSFTINNILFANGFPAVNNLTDESYYQVLANGNTKLLKHYSKSVKDTRVNTYGTVVVNHRFVDKQTWYLFKDGKMTEVTPDKKSILTALSDKSAQINSYLAGHKVNFKNDIELGGLLDYYNSL